MLHIPHFPYTFDFTWSTIQCLNIIVCLCLRSTEICPSCRTLHSPPPSAIFISVRRKKSSLKKEIKQNTKLTKCLRMRSSCFLQVRNPMLPRQRKRDAPGAEFLKTAVSISSTLHGSVNSLGAITQIHCQLI